MNRFNRFNGFNRFKRSVSKVSNADGGAECEGGRYHFISYHYVLKSIRENKEKVIIYY